MNKTSIEWTDFTWNPIRARLKGIAGQVYKDHVGTFCTRISPGCANCYASVINKRFGNGLEYTVPNLEKVEFFIDEKILEEPLRRKKPAKIFVGDMFDLFHEAIPAEMIAEVLRVAWKLKRHTFQFLTKRAERMQRLVSAAQSHWGITFDETMWFGVSVESQKYADERIPLLLQTPAVVRFVSVEPMLEAIDLSEVLNSTSCDIVSTAEDGNPRLDWVICGGESGPGARPFNLDWAESLLEQCKAAEVPFFCKQLGSYPVVDRATWDRKYRPVAISLRDRKGGDPAEWPEHLRVREFPSQKAEAVTA